MSNDESVMGCLAQEWHANRQRLRQGLFAWRPGLGTWHLAIVGVSSSSPGAQEPGSRRPGRQAMETGGGATANLTTTNAMPSARPRPCAPRPPPPLPPGLQAYAMTGWRLGYLAAPKHFAK